MTPEFHPVLPALAEFFLAPDDQLTLDECAQALGVHRKTLDRKIKKGRFPKPRLEQRDRTVSYTLKVLVPVIRRAELDEYLQFVGRKRAA